jgi:ATP-dependent DNA helicase RecQ
LNDSERHANQEAFIRDDVQIIVATIAFGMGINKPNVRFVIHYDLPKSIEGYYQEIGRAGRDDLPAHCLLLYSYGDVAKLRYFIDQKDGEERRVASQHLDAIVHYAEDGFNCRRKPLLAYFGEAYTAGKCKNCDNCSASPPVLTDITIPTQKFLSCVKRTGERFGAGHVTNVLRGSKAEKVLVNEHEKLSTYGIGAELSQKQWMQLSRQLVQLGYLSQEGEYRTLSLTPKALESLRKRSTILGQLQEDKSRPTNAKARKAELEYNHALFALVRQKRKELADLAGVPPYVIFSDKTLVEMCAYYPQSNESLLNISGVGQVKLNQYGEAFLEVIRAYCQKKDLKEKQKGSSQPISEAGGRYVMVGEAYNGGESIQSLMDRYRVRVGTILIHLSRFAAAGNPLRFDEELSSLTSVSPDEQEAAMRAFDELGTLALKPVFDELGGKINYDELKILRLIYISAKDQ